jgi:hypothetical protein
MALYSYAIAFHMFGSPPRLALSVEQRGLLQAAASPVAVALAVVNRGGERDAPLFVIYPFRIRNASKEKPRTKRGSPGRQYISLSFRSYL